MNFKERSPRILVIGVDWVGDAILSTPVFRAIRGKYPNAYLALTTPPRAVEVFKANPHVDRVIAFEEGLFIPGLAGHLRLWAELRKEHFDTAVCLHRSATRAFLAYLAGIPRRVGFRRPKSAPFLTQSVEAPHGREHRSAMYLKCLEPLGIQSHDLQTDMHITDDDRRDLEPLLRGSALGTGAPYAVIHPGGNWNLKRWPIRYFCAVVRHLKSRGVVSVICGTKGEHALADAILQESAPGSAISLCGKTSMGVLAALMEKSELVLSNDSGPIHIAASLGVPLIGLYGPTSAAVTGAISRGPHALLEEKVGCFIPCYFETCHDQLCMERLAPERVVEAIEKLTAKV